MSEVKSRYNLFPMIFMQLAKYYYFFLFLFRKWFGVKRTFTFHGKDYGYFLHPYNTTWRNERAVELPIALEILREYDPREVLEVGNVLSHYIRSAHQVVDRYEGGKNVIKEDIVNYRSSTRYKLIVCLSTLEHVGFDETPLEFEKHRKALQVMRLLLASDGRLLVTIPLGYNPDLDADLYAGQLPFEKITFMKRNSRETWEETTKENVMDAKYGKPFKAANAIAICFAKSVASVKENKCLSTKTSQ